MCIFNQLKDVQENEDILNKDFSTLCKWVANNNLSIHYGKEKTKCILSFNTNYSAQLNISYKYHNIKKYHTTEYLGYLRSNLRGKFMAMKVL